MAASVLSLSPGRTTAALSGLSTTARIMTGPASASSQPVLALDNRDRGCAEVARSDESIEADLLSRLQEANTIDRPSIKAVCTRLELMSGNL